MIDEGATEQTVASGAARFEFSPVLRYNEAEQLIVGARASWALPGVFDAFDADIQASESASYADIRFSGERLADGGTLRAVNWRLAYSHADRPAEHETLKTRALVAQVTAVSRPVGSSDAVAKIASAVEAGQQQASRNSASADNGMSEAFANWKNAVNLHAQFPRQTLSASYGLQLGFTSAAKAIDYFKHIVDVAYDARIGGTRGWWAHRPLDVVARLGAGTLTGAGPVPAAERFLGGNVDVPFLSTPGWAIRGTPVLRSYPAFQLNTPGRLGRGSDGFVAFNVTAGLPLWFQPLVPTDMADDEEIAQLIEAQLASAEGTLEVVHKSADPAHRAIAAQMQELEIALVALQARVSGLASTLSSPAREAADECDEQIETLVATMAAAKYLGFLAEESEDDVSLTSLMRVCFQELNAQINDGELETSRKTVEATLAFVRKQLALIDTARAQQRAQKDMRLPRQTVRAVFQELNAVSIGPMLMVDAARLTERVQVFDPPLHVGVGAGVRVSVVNTLHLSTGYSWNVSRSPGERRGAGFAVLEFTTLFGR
jgi:hypothetical protein